MSPWQYSLVRVFPVTTGLPVCPTARLHYSMEWFQNHSYSNVNGRITVPRSVPLESVPHRRGGPDWYEMVPLASVNSSILLASSSTVSELIAFKQGYSVTHYILPPYR